MSNDTYDETLTKAKTKALFTHLLNRTKLETVVSENSNEYDFIIRVSRHLPIVYSELSKAETPKFSIKLVSSYQGKRPIRQLCIWSTTINKTGTERGWVPLSQSKIFSSEVKSSRKKRVLAAMRTTVKAQTDYVRYSTSFPFKCPLSGSVVKDKSQMHIDHYLKPFIQIVEEWLNLYQLNYETIPLDRKGDLKCPIQFKSWYEFHQQQAVLKAVCKSANMKKGARGNAVYHEQNNK